MISGERNTEFSFHLLPMDTSQIQQLSKEFLDKLPMPGFIVLGFQTDAKNTQIVYSLKKMPLKGAVKGLAKMLEGLADQIK